MNHLNFLDAVAIGDVQELRRKEATYQGSWKKGGGRNAWAMIQRKIDRLAVMMRRPDAPDHFNMQNVDDTIAALRRRDPVPGTLQATADMIQYLRDSYVAGNIFALIRSDPTGADGSALAEVRDLRRYLVLVEAEMMARGVVPPPARPLETKITVTVGDEVRQEPASVVSDPAHLDYYPWLAAPADISRDFPSQAVWVMGHFYVQQTQQTYHLEPAVREEHFVALAETASSRYGTLAACYTRNGPWRVLDLGSAPSTERERWPVLAAEYNAHEMGLQPIWVKHLYDWQEGSSKWTIADEHRAWLAS